MQWGLVRRIPLENSLVLVYALYETLPRRVPTLYGKASATPVTSDEFVGVTFCRLLTRLLICFEILLRI